MKYASFYPGLRSSGNTLYLDDAFWSASDDASAPVADSSAPFQGILTDVINGTPGNDNLTGTAGDDTIDGGTGADTMSGLAGNDTYVVDNIGDKVIEAAGAGRDTVISSVDFTLASNVENLQLVGAATLGTGNAMDNLLEGNAAFFGLGGNDAAYIHTGSFNGGTGDDTLTIDSIDRSVYGYTGWNVMNANGNVLSQLDAHSDRSSIANALKSGVIFELVGDQVQFRMTGVENLNILAGSDGDDLVFARGNGSAYDGGAGTDTFYGDYKLSATNIAWTQAGSDSVHISSFENLILSTGSGNDSIDTTGYDTVDVNAGTGDDTLTIDSIDYSYWGTSWDVRDANGNWMVSLYATSDRSTIANALKSGVIFDLSTNNVQVRMTGVENLNVLAGSDNDDLVFARGNGSEYHGGAGTDTFYGDFKSSAANIAWTQAGSDSVHTSSFEKLILSTGSGNDSIDTTGYDTVDVNAGTGDDTLTIDSIDYSYWGTRWDVRDANGNMLAELGAGSDRSTIYNALKTGVIIDLVNDQVQVRMTGVENLNVLAGSDNDDLVFARGNGSVYNGGAGTDTFYGDYKLSATNIAWTQAGSDSVHISSFENLILSTGSGNDGIDTTGYDTVDVNAGAGDDTVTIDSIDHSGVGYTAWNVLDANGNSLAELEAGSDRTTIANALKSGVTFELIAPYEWNQVRMTGVENLNILAGSDGNDLVFARGNGSEYHGGTGSDTFYADYSAAKVSMAWSQAGSSDVHTSGFERLILSTGSGDDVIDTHGYKSADVISGAGDDMLLGGGAAAATMAGGTGNDTYVVDSKSDVVVEAAGAGIDMVQASMSYKAVANIEDVLLLGTGNLNATGNGDNNQLIGNDGANQLKGGGGDDTLIGGAGADTLAGGAGADTFVMGSLNAADLFADFQSSIDHLLVQQSGIAVGNGDTVIDGAVVRQTPGGFAAASELVVCADKIHGAINEATAAAIIGNANDSYTVGQTALFAVNNGKDSALYLFQSSGMDGVVSAGELHLISKLAGNAALGIQDFQFGP
jgi:Ca2+-binding RTX toxin-like protein